MIISKFLNKSFITNFVAAIITIIGFLTPCYGELLIMTGSFALSGAITNWLAVHMLFEKIPFLYGSGVIAIRFEEFKKGIRHLILSEFFTTKNITIFFGQQNDKLKNKLFSQMDFDRVFDGLIETVEKSQMGAFLGLMGGKESLEQLRTPMIEKLKNICEDLISNTESNDQMLLAHIVEQVQQIIDTRLEQLTPDQVKNIIQEMIRKHLGWLVVWGGVFGAIIGLFVGIVEKI